MKIHFARRIHPGMMTGEVTVFKPEEEIEEKYFFQIKNTNKPVKRWDMLVSDSVDWIFRHRKGYLTHADIFNLDSREDKAFLELLYQSIKVSLECFVDFDHAARYNPSWFEKKTVVWDGIELQVNLSMLSNKCHLPSLMNMIRNESYRKEEYRMPGYPFGPARSLLARLF